MISKVKWLASISHKISRRTLTVNITLAFVGLRHKEVGHMPSDTIRITNCIPAKYFLQAIGESVRIIEDPQLKLTFSH